jgi:SAM-dependent methyltransferase
VAEIIPSLIKKCEWYNGVIMTAKSNETLQQTIATYEQNLSYYTAHTPLRSSGPFKDFVDVFLSYLSRGEKVLEIGSGTGRDATYCIENGFDVQPIEVTQSFAKYMKQDGLDPIFFDALETSLETKYDAVMALAVFLHFNEAQFNVALVNVKRHLKEGGLLALRMKWGEGEEVINRKMNGPRYFKYWQPGDLEKKLMSVGFEIEYSMNFLAEGNKDGPDKGWLQYIARTC